MRHVVALKNLKMRQARTIQNAIAVSFFIPFTSFWSGVYAGDTSVHFSFPKLIPGPSSRRVSSGKSIFLYQPSHLATEEPLHPTRHLEIQKHKSSLFQCLLLWINISPNRRNAFDLFKSHEIEYM